MRPHNRADVLAAPSFHCVVSLTFHIFPEESFEPLQELKVPFGIPFYELLHWKSLNQDKEDMATF